MEPIEKIPFENHTIFIYPDEDPPNPRDNDNLGSMVFFHERYSLGDKHTLTPEDLKELVKREEIISLPVYMYDHSGIYLSTGRGYPFDDPWDSGMLGYIYVTLEKVKKDFKGTKYSVEEMKKLALEQLQFEVEEYKDYLTGNVVGYVVENNSGAMIDSCWGFFGKDGYKMAIEDAKETIKHHNSSGTYQI